MKKIISFLALLTIILILGCSKKEETVSEPIVTAEVVKAEPEIEEEQEIEENVTTVKLCHDTDNGIVRWVNGTIFGFYSNATRFQFDDYCQNKNYLMEFYCEDENPMQRLFLCKNGCIDAHCA